MILLFFVVNVFGQQFIDKSIISESDKVVIEFGLIDHIELFNSESLNKIHVRAAGAAGQIPGFELLEANGYVLLKDIGNPNEKTVYEEDKACSIVPNYTSYDVYVPEGKELYVSFIEGNFYTGRFKGTLDIKVESGIIKLDEVLGKVMVRLNSGSVFVDHIKNTNLDAETNLGIIMNYLNDEAEVKSTKKLKLSLGDQDHSIMIRAIMANIFLYGPKD